MNDRFPAFDPPARLLLGPGPSPVPPSVQLALAKPTLGHLDPRFLEAMDQVVGMLKRVFETENTLTLPISGTGSSGMEAVICNLVEPGDRVLVGVCGAFGARMADVARRAGADVVEVTGEWGKSLPIDELRKRAASGRFALLCAVHAETSTGVLQPLEPLRELADEIGALLVIDAVTSLGGIRVEADTRRLDAIYSGSQKCLSCPPGLAPVTLSAAAQKKLTARTRPVQSFYMDLGLLSRYWGKERVYHHTASSNLVYGLHEALRLALEEGLEARAIRHRTNARAMSAGLEALGLELVVAKPAERLPPITTVRVPDGVDEAALRAYLLERHSLEIGTGLGPFKGKAVRIGLMGFGSTRNNVLLCLTALRAALAAQRFPVRDDPVPAAEAVYSEIAAAKSDRN